MDRFPACEAHGLHRPCDNHGEGLIDRSQVQQHLRHFVSEYNRPDPTKYAKLGDSRLFSLDQLLFENGNATLADTVTWGLWE
jgi:hypothetical protein